MFRLVGSDSIRCVGGHMRHSYFEGPVTPDVILGLNTDEAASFVRDTVSRKSLSQTVRALNLDVLSGDAARKDKALKALRKLGFV